MVFLFLSFSDFAVLLLVAVSSIFGYYFSSFFFLLDDSGGVLILGRCVFVFCVNEDEQTLSLLQVYHNVSVFEIKN